MLNDVGIDLSKPAPDFAFIRRMDRQVDELER
jgi:hypothetical protein